MRPREEAFRILEVGLRTASAEVEDAEVALCGGSAGWVRIAGNQVQPAQRAASEAVAVRVWRRGRSARALSTDITAEGIAEAARRAATALPRDGSGAGAAWVPSPQVYAEVDAWDEATSRLHPLERLAVAGKAIQAGQTRGLTAFGRVGAGRGGLLEDGRVEPYAIANTRGLLAYHASTWARLDVGFGHGMRRGTASGRAHALRLLDPATRIAEASWVACPEVELHTLAPGRYPAVLAPAAVAALVRWFGELASFEAVQRNESYLNEEFAVDSRLELFDDYGHPAHRGCPFDATGVPRTRHPLILAGRPGKPLVGWGRDGGPEPTGHLGYGPDGRPEVRARHLVLAGGGDGPVERLIRGTEQGLFVGGLEGVRLLDGRRIRVAGCTAGLFAIRGGELAEPLGELRFDLSVLDLLSTVDRVGEPVWTGDGVVPPVRAADLPLYAWT